MIGVCRRWAVLYCHDSSPVDGGIFVHQAAAFQHMVTLENKAKLCVGMVCIIPEEVMMRILSAIPDGTE